MLISSHLIQISVILISYSVANIKSMGEMKSIFLSHRIESLQYSLVSTNCLAFGFAIFSYLCRFLNTLSSSIAGVTWHNSKCEGNLLRRERNSYALNLNILTHCICCGVDTLHIIIIQKRIQRMNRLKNNERFAKDPATWSYHMSMLKKFQKWFSGCKTQDAKLNANTFAFLVIFFTKWKYIDCYFTVSYHVKMARIP